LSIIHLVPQVTARRQIVERRNAWKTIMPIAYSVAEMLVISALRNYTRYWEKAIIK
jgi:hypothetical protein